MYNRKFADCLDVPFHSNAFADPKDFATIQRLDSAVVALASSEVRVLLEKRLNFRGLILGDSKGSFHNEPFDSLRATGSGKGAMVRVILATESFFQTAKIHKSVDDIVGAVA